MRMKKTNQTLKRGYLICLFLALTIWSMATTSGSGPDEAMKYDICNYIASHGKLPDGTDPALRNPIWGIWIYSDSVIYDKWSFFENSFFIYHKCVLAVCGSQIHQCTFHNRNGIFDVSDRRVLISNQ